MPLAVINPLPQSKARAVVTPTNAQVPIRWRRKYIYPPYQIITPASGNAGDLLTPPFPTLGAIAICTHLTRIAGTGFNLRTVHLVTNPDNTVRLPVGPNVGTHGNPVNNAWTVHRYNLTTGFPAVAIAADAAWSNGNAFYILILTLVFAS